jgi:hypothetical protein
LCYQSLANSNIIYTLIYNITLTTLITVLTITLQV